MVAFLPDTKYEFELEDGSLVRGHIVSDRHREILVRLWPSSLGLTLKRNTLRAWRPAPVGAENGAWLPGRWVAGPFGPWTSECWACGSLVRPYELDSGGRCPPCTP